MLRVPAFENSAMTSTIASGASILTTGDFSHFLIADRLGMTTELVPHLMGANRRPTLQRGFLAYWRTTSGVLAMNAFRTLKVT